MYKEYTPFQQINTISYSIVSPSIASSRIIEGIDADTNTVEQNINNLDTTIQKVETGKTQLYQNYLDISNNIDKYSITTNYLSNNNNIYHYNDEEDPNTLFNYNKPKDIHTAINDDIAELQLYQNSIYITGIIACGTLLISAILISKK